MRRDINDDLLRSLLAFTTALSAEVRGVRKLLAARDEEAKHNPNWRKQPRAPRGVREGGQWVDSVARLTALPSGGARTIPAQAHPQPAPPQPSVARQPGGFFPSTNDNLPRSANDARPARLARITRPSPPPPAPLLETLGRWVRPSPFALLLSIPGDTPRPEILDELVPGTNDLRIVVATYVDGRTVASFYRMTRPERRVRTLINGVETGFEHVEPAEYERLHVPAIVQGFDVVFDPSVLVREYGREIEGVTTIPSGPPLSGEPVLAPVTPEESLIDYNLRQLGASPLEIFVAISNHRAARNNERALRAALWRQTSATQFEIDNIVRAVREARIQAASIEVPLIPNNIEELFEDIDHAPRNSIVNLRNEHWALLPEEIVSSDTATLAAARPIISEIRELSPNYEPPQLRTLGLAGAQQARSEYINEIRFDRAVAIYRVHGDYRPLQVETLRFAQLQTDLAYAAARDELENGRLTFRLSEAEGIGNYIDGELRNITRLQFTNYGLDWARGRDIRVQRREYDTFGDDLSYGIPDAAVGHLMFDVTISKKLPGLAQIQRYFAADSNPMAVIIVNPTALGGAYLITPPDSR